ncbi:hypothetical protein B0H13DRAFT_2319979 [Mycena leptocephala]|nr:hypothetical protein B0H13DRAFT_2319979 [Mycena leptocephala]
MSPADAAHPGKRSSDSSSKQQLAGGQHRDGHPALGFASQHGQAGRHHVNRNGPDGLPQSRLALPRTGERNAALGPQWLDEEAAREADSPTPETTVFAGNRQKRAPERTERAG